MFSNLILGKLKNDSSYYILYIQKKKKNVLKLYLLCPEATAAARIVAMPIRTRAHILSFNVCARERLLVSLYIYNLLSFL